MIPKEPPAAGTVLRYAYLRKRESDAGRDEGVKDRPVPGATPATFVYGRLSRGPFTQALTLMKALLREAGVAGVSRT